MKILYILKRDLDDTFGDILESHKKSCDVTVIDLRENKNYEEIIELVQSNDKVICI